MNTLQKDMKVLILVKEKIVALDIKTILLNQGFNIQSIFLPQKNILNKIKTEKPDLIIIDILPRELNLYINLIRNIRKYFKASILLISSLLEQEVFNLLDDIKDIYFLQKPFLERDIVDLLNDNFSLCTA